jgi:hypothetical protein
MYQQDIAMPLISPPATPRPTVPPARPPQAAALRWKLSTRRPDGANEHFAQQHAEQLPGSRLKEVEAKLAAQASSGAAAARRATRLGFEGRLLPESSGLRTLHDLKHTHLVVVLSS